MALHIHIKLIIAIALQKVFVVIMNEADVIQLAGLQATSSAVQNQASCGKHTLNTDRGHINS